VRQLTKAQQTLLEFRRHLFFFDGLTDNELLTIAKSVSFTRYGAGEIIFEQGTGGREVHFILQGEVAIAIGKQERIGEIIHYYDFITVAHLQKKEVFGEMSAITGLPRSARATAVSSETMILSFTLLGWDQKRGAIAYTKLYENFIGVLSGRIRQINDTLIQQQLAIY